MKEYDMRLDDKVASVTGAASGIGKRIAQGYPIEPQVRRWLPLAVPGLAVLICVSIVLVWSIL